MFNNAECNDAVQIQIRLVTKQEQYSIPDNPISVPVSLEPQQLNKLVNTLIEQSQISDPKLIEFEFLIENELLRTSLKEHIETKDFSTETVLQVEYFERLSAPKPQDCFNHDDWVSSVEARGNFILSGAYDGSAHIWTNTGDAVVSVLSSEAAISITSLSIKAVAWVSLNDTEATFLSAGQEQAAFLWRWNRTENVYDCLAAYRGHARSIESVAVSPNATRFASVGWDGFLKVWPVSDISSSEPAPKRSKRDPGDEIPSKAPEMTLKGHRDCVSCVRWLSDGEILSSSWDQTLRLWDVEEAGMKQEMIGNKAFLSCDMSILSGLILATSADKNIRLFDPRSTEGSIIKQTYTSHTSWVQSVRWSKDDDKLFVSASQDNMVKLWDLRSPKAPLYEMAGHTDKVLCCDWSEPGIIVSGGADNAVRIFTAPSK